MPADSARSTLPSGAAPVQFVLLGASNLARAYTALSRHLKQCLHPRPVSFLHALGAGRGYCAAGGVLHVVYAPIADTPVFTAAREQAERGARTVALVTDIGSDIMYDVTAAEINACLGDVFERLTGFGADVFVTPIHVDMEHDVKESQFRALRRIFYPHSRTEYSEAARAIVEINRFLEESSGRPVHLLPSMKEYCGADKIHYSLFKMHHVWNRIARALLEPLGVRPHRHLDPLKMAGSLLANMNRLLFTDMVRLRKKSPGTF